MTASSHRRIPFLLALAAALTSAPLWAATPRDELLRLAPDDVGLCVLVQDLRGHAAALADSPFLAQFRASVIGKMIGSSQEMRQLTAAEKVLKQHLETDWPQLRDDILGDAVLFGYRPGPPDHPEQEQGFVILRAPNAPLLEKLINRLNTVQKQAGDLKELEERQHNGVTYYRRVERKQTPYFYYLRGPVLAASAQEAMLQTLIDRDRQAPAADEAAPPLARQLRELALERSLLVLWLNPRSFEPDLEQKARAAQGAEAAFLANFLVYWKALDGVAFFLTPGDALELGAAVKARTAALPAAARRFLDTASQPSELWGAIPEDALLAVAGRVDFPALIEMICEFLTPGARKSLRDAFERGAWPLGKFSRDLLPALGPDVGLCILAPAAQDKTWVPRLLWALRVQPGSGDRPADQALLDALNVFAGLAVLDWNSKRPGRLTLKTETQDKQEVRSFVNPQFPAGLQPTYALKAGYLLLASSPDLVKLFQVQPPREPAGEVPLLRVSLVTLQNYLKQNHEPLIAFFAEKNHLTKEETAHRLDAFLTGLQFFHGIELTQRSASGQAVLTLRVRPAQPLKKRTEQP